MEARGRDRTGRGGGGPPGREQGNKAFAARQHTTHTTRAWRLLVAAASQVLFFSSRRPCPHSPAQIHVIHLPFFILVPVLRSSSHLLAPSSPPGGHAGAAAQARSLSQLCSALGQRTRCGNRSSSPSQLVVPSREPGGKRSASPAQWVSRQGLMRPPCSFVSRAASEPGRANQSDWLGVPGRPRKKKHKMGRNRWRAAAAPIDFGLSRPSECLSRACPRCVSPSSWCSAGLAAARFETMKTCS